MNQRNLTVGFIILLIGLAISPGFNAQNLSISTITEDESRYFIPDGSQEVIWDNRMKIQWIMPSQLDESYQYDAITADDFQFINDTIVNDAYWYGAMAQGDYKEFDMEIIFYYDRGDGNAPGEIYKGPFYFLNEDTNETFISGGIVKFYSYYVSFPEPIEFEGNVSYWISIQAVGEVYPQWYIACHWKPILLHECVFRCEYLYYPYWTDSTIVMGNPHEICFQLIQRENNPPSAPCIDGPTEGKYGVEYCFTFHSTHPDSKEVKYIIYWGDGTTNETDFYQSCTPVEVCHTWEIIGYFAIHAKAVDKQGFVSDFGYLEIEIPKTRLIEQFPILEVLLRLIDLLR